MALIIIPGTNAAGAAHQATEHMLSLLKTGMILPAARKEALDKTCAILQSLKDILTKAEQQAIDAVQSENNRALQKANADAAQAAKLLESIDGNAYPDYKRQLEIATKMLKTKAREIVPQLEKDEREICKEFDKFYKPLINKTDVLLAEALSLVP